MYRKELIYLNIAWNPIEDLSPLVEWVPCTLLNDEKNAEFPGVEFDMSGIQLEEIEEEKGIHILEEMLFHKLIAESCGLKDIRVIKRQLKIRYLDISNNPIKGLSGVNNLKFLQEIVAKNTLIDGDKIKIFKLLSTSGVYGIPVYSKMPFMAGNFYGLEGKTEWVRVIFK